MSEHILSMYRALGLIPNPPTHTRTHARTCTYMHTGTHTYAYTHAHAGMSTHVHCTCTHIHTCIRTHTGMCVHTQHQMSLSFDKIQFSSLEDGYLSTYVTGSQ